MTTKAQYPMDITTTPTQITVQVGDVVRHYTLFETTAPPSYDGFGTFTVYGDEDTTSRVVLINQEHESWQTGRYGSGLYPCWPAIMYSKTDLVELLWGRMVSPD